MAVRGYVEPKGQGDIRWVLFTGDTRDAPRVGGPNDGVDIVTYTVDGDTIRVTFPSPAARPGRRAFALQRATGDVAAARSAGLAPRGEPLLQEPSTLLDGEAKKPTSAQCDAIDQLAKHERSLGGREAYADSVLQYHPLGIFTGDGLVTIMDGNVVNPSRVGSSTVDGVDFNYFETTYAGATQAGEAYGAMGSGLWTEAGLLRDILTGNFGIGYKDYRQDVAGIHMGLSASRHKDISAYHAAVCGSSAGGK